MGPTKKQQAHLAKMREQRQANQAHAKREREEGQAKKKKRKKPKHAVAVDGTVAAQPDAPGAVQQQQQRAPPPPPPAGQGPGGRSVFAPLAATSGGKKGKGELPSTGLHFLGP